jgi:hypothetical protein
MHRPALTSLHYSFPWSRSAKVNISFATLPAPDMPASDRKPYYRTVANWNQSAEETVVMRKHNRHSHDFKSLLLNKVRMKNTACWKMPANVLVPVQAWSGITEGHMRRVDFSESQRGNLVCVR